MMEISSRQNIIKRGDNERQAHPDKDEPVVLKH
jgi:hypothetical protein